MNLEPLIAEGGWLLWCSAWLGRIILRCLTNDVFKRRLKNQCHLITLLLGLLHVSVCLGGTARLGQFDVRLLETAVNIPAYFESQLPIPSDVLLNAFAEAPYVPSGLLVCFVKLKPIHPVPCGALRTDCETEIMPPFDSLLAEIEPMASVHSNKAGDQGQEKDFNPIHIIVLSVYTFVVGFVIGRILRYFKPPHAMRSNH